jgi:hypothetical protein
MLLFSTMQFHCFNLLVPFKSVCYHCCHNMIYFLLYIFVACVFKVQVALNMLKGQNNYAYFKILCFPSLNSSKYIPIEEVHINILYLMLCSKY